jgi:hypothetical protein
MAIAARDRSPLITALPRPERSRQPRDDEMSEQERSPATESLVKKIKARTGTAPDLTEIKTAVEESIRAIKLSQSNIQGAVSENDDASFEIKGIANMPAYLQRFLAERAQEPGFTYEVEQDPVRGWIVSWKEMTNRGTVRGYGQFCERPYAWLDD